MPPDHIAGSRRRCQPVRAAAFPRPPKREALSVGERYLRHMRCLCRCRRRGLPSWTSKAMKCSNAGVTGEAIAMLDKTLAATGETVRDCLQPASEACLTYAYALYDLGRALRLDGDPADAVPVLQRRLQIENQRRHRAGTARTGPRTEDLTTTRWRPGRARSTAAASASTCTRASSRQPASPTSASTRSRMATSARSPRPALVQVARARGPSSGARGVSCLPGLLEGGGRAVRGRWR